MEVRTSFWDQRRIDDQDMSAVENYATRAPFQLQSIRVNYSVVKAINCSCTRTKSWTPKDRAFQTDCRVRLRRRKYGTNEGRILCRPAKHDSRKTASDHVNLADLRRNVLDRVSLILGCQINSMVANSGIQLLSVKCCIIMACKTV